MDIPIYIGETETGRLAIEKRGALTVMRAELQDPGRVVRLYVFGEREAYLGVPAPEGEGGRLVLTRRLSPSELRRFPKFPEYAGECPRLPASEPGPGRKRHVLWHGGKPYFF